MCWYSEDAPSSFLWVFHLSFVAAEDHWQVKGQDLTCGEAGLPAPKLWRLQAAGAAGHRWDLGIIPELIIDSLPPFTPLSPDTSAPPPPPSRPVCALTR